MTEDEFLALARAGYNRIPLRLETLADLDTPLSIYCKLANRPGSYLLESVIGGERFGRYSIVGLPARERIEVAGRRVLRVRDGAPTDDREVDDPLAYIDEYLRSFRAAPVGPALRFAGGLAGYFGYDIVRYIEPRLGRVPKPDPLGMPDIRLLLSEELAVVDNLSGKLTFVVYANPEHADAYDLARRRLDSLQRALRQPVQIPHAPQVQRYEARSEFGEQAFKDAVARCKQYIFDGDIMQVVLAQRMAQPFPASPLSLYRALRSVNP